MWRSAVLGFGKNKRVFSSGVQTHNHTTQVRWPWQHRLLVRGSRRLCPKLRICTALLTQRTSIAASQAALLLWQTLGLRHSQDLPFLLLHFATWFPDLTPKPQEYFCRRRKLFCHLICPAQLGRKGKSFMPRHLDVQKCLLIVVLFCTFSIRPSNTIHASKQENADFSGPLLMSAPIAFRCFC